MPRPEDPDQWGHRDDAVDHQGLRDEGRTPASIEDPPGQVDILPVPASRIELQALHRRSPVDHVGRGEGAVEPESFDMVLEEWNPVLGADRPTLDDPNRGVFESGERSAQP